MSLRRRLEALEAGPTNRRGAGAVRDWSDEQLRRFLSDEFASALRGAERPAHIDALASRLAAGTATDKDLELLLSRPSGAQSVSELIAHFAGLAPT